MIFLMEKSTVLKIKILFQNINIILVKILTAYCANNLPCSHYIYIRSTWFLTYC